jgi:hypothetical protein
MPQMRVAIVAAFSLLFLFAACPPMQPPSSSPRPPNNPPPTNTPPPTEIPPPGTPDDNAGKPCQQSSDCGSGVCEGQGCGPDQPGVCAPAARGCTRDLREYCGCNGNTFRASGSCPGQRYSAKGACP